MEIVRGIGLSLFLIINWKTKWGGGEGFIAAVFYCVTAYPQPYIDLLICLVIVFRVNRIALVVGELASQKNWKKHLKQTELQT